MFDTTPKIATDYKPMIKLIYQIPGSINLVLFGMV
jgi:hypothetical protein